MNTEAFRQAAAGLDLDLSAAQIDRFAEFEEGLYEANAFMNLTRVPRAECRQRHFIDSLLLHDLIPRGASVLDIGAGPGFPSWPLACARPDLRVTALDSSGKMVGFLSRRLLPNLEAVLGRAEEWGARERFDFVTGRAVAPLAIQLELSAAACRMDGMVVPMRTRSDDAQIQADAAALGLKLVEVHRRPLPGTNIERVFPVYRKVAPTALKYPRTWAEIRRSPLF